MGIKDYISKLAGRKPAPVLVSEKPLYAAPLSIGLEQSTLSGTVDISGLKGGKILNLKGLYTDFELLYRRDGVIFGTVNKESRDVSGAPIIVDAKDEAIKGEVEQWISRPAIALREVMKNIISDNLVFGNSWYELVPNVGMDDIVRLVRKDPKTMDFKRDTYGDVIVDEWGKPTTVVEEQRGVYKEHPKEFCGHFALFKLPDDPIGISPLEALYATMKYKLNVEKATSQGYWRQGFPPIIASVGTETMPATPDMLKDVKKAFEKIQDKLAIILPHYVKVDRIEAEQLRDVDKQLDYLVARIKEAYSIGGDATDYERTIINYQRQLEGQLKEEILEPLAKIRGWSEVPSVRLVDISPETKLTSARVLSLLGRGGLVVYDAKLENYLRKVLSLPELDLDKLTKEEEEKRGEVQRRKR
jgi:hypothetical protein